MPDRIQRQRKKGWKMPPNTVYVGRPTKWGNPWDWPTIPCNCRSVGECTHNTFRRDTATECVEEYRQWIVNGKRRINMLDELRGKNLSCWCSPGLPCHADVLLELANR